MRIVLACLAALAGCVPALAAPADDRLVVRTDLRGPALGRPMPDQGLLEQPMPAPSASPMPAPPVPLSPSAGLSLEAHVVVELLTRKLKLDLTDPAGAQVLGQLASFYAKPGRRILWVDRHGYLPKAAVAIDELARADDYALDPAAFKIASLTRSTDDPASLAAAEVNLSLAVVRYAFHARGGRLEPTALSLWLDYKPKPVDAAAWLTTLAAAEDPAAALRALHPRHFQFESLRRAYLKERDGAGPAESRASPLIPMGVRIKPGRRHPDVALARQRLGKPAADGDDTLLDSDFQIALHRFMNEEAGIPYGRNRGIDDDVRQALNGGARPGDRRQLDLIRANMERWRWLPADFGDLYVWNNLPEFETRVVRNGEIIHRERIVIGQVATQTPVFSDAITRVIFNPDWNVPESIKLATIWPNLRGGDYGVLKRRNMRIMHEGREINPAKLRYAELNARDVPVVMGPGADNPLGRFKFVFPNKHDVYMHDTTSKGLFAERERTFSHGCIRVRDPQRFAEVLLAEAKGWNAADVAWQTRTKTTVRIELDRAVPIHNTYFTLVADASGVVRQVSDVYGHDKRVIDALNGVDPKKIAESDPALALKRRNEQLAAGAVVMPAVVKAGTAKPRPRAVAVRPVYSSPYLYRPVRPAYYARPSSPRATRPRARGLFGFW